MGLKNLLLKPFRSSFKAPTINTPMSTIELPSVKFCMALISISFIFIAGGIVYCWVQGSPMMGYIRRREDGKITLSWYDNNGLGSQFGGEGIIASSTYTLGALSLLAAVYVMKNGHTEDDLTDTVLYFFALSAPVWPILSLMVFQTKIPGYFPLPRA